MQLSVAEIVFQGIPEIIALAAICCAVAQVQAGWKALTLAGIVLGPVIFGIRMLPIPFGVHAFLMTLVGVFCLVRFARVSPLKAFGASFAALACLVIFEGIVHVGLYINLLGLDLTDPQGSVTWIVMGWPQVILMFLMALVIGKIFPPKRRTGREGPYHTF